MCAGISAHEQTCARPYEYDRTRKMPGRQAGRHCMADSSLDRFKQALYDTIEAEIATVEADMRSHVRMRMQGV